MPTLKGCTVEAVTLEEARPLILKYEWLGTIGRAYAAYGLRAPDGELIGATLFGQPGSPQAGDICGSENRALSICLERGACVHWAHPHAASFLISRACKQAAEDQGWRIFYAYSDPAAGELGTVYQASNWLYLGQGIGRGRSTGKGRSVIIDPAGREYSPRGLRHRGIKVADVRHWPGWKVERRPAKHKYVWLADRRLRKALRYPVLPYPKR